MDIELAISAVVYTCPLPWHGVMEGQKPGNCAGPGPKLVKKGVAKER